MSRGLTYQPSLDGLRALAVSAVVLFHTWPTVFPGGWVGVDLFFVLSGFLITSILVKEIDSTGTLSLKRFYIRRALRLTPALLALIAAFLLFSVVVGNDLRRAGFGALMAGTYLTNWSRAFGWGDSQIGHTWSLAIEEQFYLVWPLLLLFLLRLPRPALWVAALAIAAALWRVYLFYNGASPVRLFNGFDTHVDPILIGCVLALLPRMASGRGVLFAAGALLAILFALPSENPLAITGGSALAGMLGAWLIAAALREGRVKQMLSWAPLVFVGQISYGIYLWHHPIILVGHFHIPEAWWFVLPLLGVACAVGSYYLIERPFLRLKDRWTDAPPMGPAAPPATAMLSAGSPA